MNATARRQAILVGIDGSPPAAAALSWAVDEARLRGVGLNVMHVFPTMLSIVGTRAHEYYPQVEDDAKAIFEHALASAPAMDDLDVERTLVPGNPSERLVDASRRATMLVVGANGRGRFLGMLLGSVSMHCVSQAHCPVVVVRGPN
jgi:nucleotide-binding universal stress UspA family protein